MRRSREIASSNQARTTIEVRPRRCTLPGKLLIRLKPEAVRAHAGERKLSFARSDVARLPESISKPIEWLENNAGLWEVRPLFHEHTARLKRAPLAGGARRRMAALSSVIDSTPDEIAGVNVVELDPKKCTKELMRRLRESKALDIVEAAPARWLTAKKKPVSDPKQNLQWGLTAIRWFQAHRPSAAKLVCGIIDTGVDDKHPDLAGAIASYDHAGSSAKDLIGHGTHVAGIVAATTNNHVGISGVADCRLAIWKVFADEPDPEDGEFYVDIDRYLEGLRAMEKAEVCALNLSLGGTESSKVEALLMKRLAKAGVCVLAAMGNEFEEGNPIEYPGAYETVWAVGAVDSASRRASFSNTGKHIHLVAPGVNILSTLPRTKSKWRTETSYAAWDGTSMATPYVTGAAVLVRAQGQHKTPKRIAQRLATSATRLPAMAGKSHTNQLGAGLLNLEKALQ